MSIKRTGAIAAVARCTVIGFVLILAFPPTAYGIDLTGPKVKLQIARERDTPPPVIAYGPPAGFGNTCADLAGGVEWEWERENREKGIPVAPEHEEVMAKLAGEIGVEAPFSRYDQTRF